MLASRAVKIIFKFCTDMRATSDSLCSASVG